MIFYSAATVNVLVVFYLESDWYFGILFEDM